MFLVEQSSTILVHSMKGMKIKFSIKKMKINGSIFFGWDSYYKTFLP